MQVSHVQADLIGTYKMIIGYSIACAIECSMIEHSIAQATLLE